ncbi:MAG: hypothetical protein JST11_13195 [Acidobacteria bacterium]|nr:hypothetical protein [Acidobacteriota bacterium]
MRAWAAIAIASAALAAPPAPRWHIIGPGGGGSMFHPTVSPHDAWTVVLACDMTGNYVTTDGGAHWRFFSLRSPVRLFAFDPAVAKVLYASTGALYRSADLGLTWKMILPRPGDLAKTTAGDDHASETLHVRAGPPADVAAFAIDPADSKSLYAAVGKTLWSSSDTGGTWHAIADLTAPVSAIWIDATSPAGDRAIYAAGPDAIYIRRGGRWSSGASPGPFTSVDAAPPVFYAISGGRIWISEGGVKWRVSDTPAGLQPALVAAAANHPDSAYAVFEGAGYSIARTADRGKHWELQPYNGRDAWLSETFGAAWAGRPYGIGVAPGDPHIAYATDSGRVMHTTDGGRTWLSAYSLHATSGHWTTNGIDVTTCYGVHFDPFDARRMFISYTDIGLWGSGDGGASWYSATREGVPRAWINTTYWVEFDPTVRGRIWAAMSGVHDLPRPKMWRRRAPSSFNGGVVRSDDGGRTWRVQNNGMPETAATHILRDPAGALYVAGFGRGVFKSTDAGEHWSLQNAGIEGSQPLAWRIVRDSRGALYLIVARRSEDGSIGNEGDGALYRSTDAAGHWTRLRLPEGVNGPNGLAADPRDPHRLYLAAWGRNTPDGATGGGIWLSTDSAATWRSVLARDQHIYDVTIHPRDPRRLYAAGFEGNAWQSTDSGLTWTRIPGFDFKWGHRVLLDPRDPRRLYITTFGGSVWTGPAD